MALGPRPLRVLWVELLGKNLALGRAEAIGAAEALGGGIGPEGSSGIPDGFVAIAIPEDTGVGPYAERLALARRVLHPFPDRPAEGLARILRQEGGQGRSAAFRELGGAARTPVDPWLIGWANAYKEGGGRIDLSRPERTFLIQSTPGDGPRLFEEVGTIPASSYRARRMPYLPFQRPVALDPRLARAAVNLGRVRAGDRVVDPFLGTGALAIEAALLGARVTGVDRDDVMVKGALRNFAYLGQSLDEAWVDDAETAASHATNERWDSIITDPPYGRASGSGGEPAESVVRRVLPAWAARLRPDGRIVVIQPGGPDPLGPPWRREETIRDRVHRSLTREFRVYRREGPIRRP